jgi:hypothetical protein
MTSGEDGCAVNYGKGVGNWNSNHNSYRFTLILFCLFREVNTCGMNPIVERSTFVRGRRCLPRMPKYEAVRRHRLVPAQEVMDHGKDQNLIIVLRVIVTWLVTPAGPPLKRWNAAYCSMYVSSEDRQSIGMTTL